MDFRFRRFFCRTLWLVFAGTVGFWTTPEALAFGDGPDATEPVRLRYHAGAGCPDEELFRGFIRARTSHVRAARGGETARTFVVYLETLPHPRGTVMVSDGVGEEGVRTVSADSCADAADAVALIVALAIDPRALLSRTSADPPPAEPDAGPAAAAIDAGELPATGLPVASDASTLEVRPAAGPVERTSPAGAGAPVPLRLEAPRLTPVPHRR